jgi:hypothetical protein
MGVHIGEMTSEVVATSGPEAGTAAASGSPGANDRRLEVLSVLRESARMQARLRAVDDDD